MAEAEKSAGNRKDNIKEWKKDEEMKRIRASPFVQSKASKKKMIAQQ